MPLMKCPECGHNVSSSADSCPECGYPIQKYLKDKVETGNIEDIIFKAEIDWLVNKVKPVTFHCPEPRAKVCAKCGLCVDSVTDKPRCTCNSGNQQYPIIEVDYPAAGIGLNRGVDLYIYEKCVDPRNIGDRDSTEYKSQKESIYKGIQHCAAFGRYIRPIPPNPKWFGVTPTKETERAAMDELMEAECKQSGQTSIPPKPKCPYCGSDHLSKISTVKKAAKIELFGLFGAGDLGKTWRCDNCGGKF